MSSSGEYGSRESGEWRVEIVKTDASRANNEDVITRYDVRKIPKPDRHETIHHRYGMIPDGGTMELIAPHTSRDRSVASSGSNMVMRSSGR